LLNAFFTFYEFINIEYLMFACGGSEIKKTERPVGSLPKAKPEATSTNIQFSMLFLPVFFNQRFDPAADEFGIVYMLPVVDLNPGIETRQPLF
jgi:hypothetical protein